MLKFHRVQGGFKLILAALKLIPVGFWLNIPVGFWVNIPVGSKWKLILSSFIFFSWNYIQDSQKLNGYRFKKKVLSRLFAKWS